MLLRKILAACCTSIAAVVSLTIVEFSNESFSAEDGELFFVIAAYSIYAVPVVFIYGILSSLIAEGVSGKIANFKNAASLGLHMLFGAGFILPYSLFFEYQSFPELSAVYIVTHPVTVFGALFSILFFIFDYMFGKKDYRRKENRD